MEFTYLIFLSVIYLYFSFKISKKFELYDNPDGKKIHNEKIPNLGGSALIPYALTMLYFFNYSHNIKTTIYLLLIVIIIGIIDDIKNINPQLKLLALLLPVYLFTKDIGTVKSLGVYAEKDITIGPLSLLFTVLSIFLLTNAFNYIDGLDGILAVNVIITLTTLYFVIKGEGNIFFPLIIFFTIYFLYNKNFLKIFPKQFIGDSGSLGIGFLISAFLIIYTQLEFFLHPSIIIWTVAFVVYEFLSVNIIRIKQGKNIFKKDLSFIFNLLNKKYSSTKTMIICSAIHVFFCSISIVFSIYNNYILSIILFILFFFIFLLYRFKQIS